MANQIRIPVSQLQPGDVARFGPGPNWVPVTVESVRLLTADEPHPERHRFPAPHPLHDYTLPAGSVMVKFVSGGWVCPNADLVVCKYLTGAEMVTEAQVVDAMETYGGGFVKALAAAWRKADSGNANRLRNAFPDYYCEYEQIARDNKARAAKAAAK